MPPTLDCHYHSIMRPGSPPRSSTLQALRDTFEFTTQCIIGPSDNTSCSLELIPSSCIQDTRYAFGSVELSYLGPSTNWRGSATSSNLLNAVCRPSDRWIFNITDVAEISPMRLSVLVYQVDIFETRIWWRFPKIVVTYSSINK